MDVVISPSKTVVESMTEIQQLTGPAAIKQVFRAVLDASSKRLRTALADRPLVYLTGDEFADEFMRERKARGIHLQSLRFTSTADLDRADHKNFAQLDKEVRTAPVDLTIGSSLVLWDDHVVVITTEPDIRAVWIQDPALAETINVWFEYLWHQSK